jgi:hypothetical protein
MTINVNVNLLATEQYHTIMNGLADVNSKLEKIMASQVELQTALDKIDAASTKQGATLQVEADTLQTISTEWDTLLATVASGTITDAQLAQAQKLADMAQSVSDSLDAQAAFSTALASKGANNPVPVPVPEPTPAPAPTS